MARVLRAVFRFKQAGRLADAGALLSWLSGSGNVAAGIKREAGIKGDIESRDAMDYLLGLLAVVRKAGYKGLMIVIDEAETILRMRQDVRGKSLNGIRQIIDAADRYPGLLWVFTGTPDFFDSKRGVAGLEPLHTRIGFQRIGKSVPVTQAQLELKPFDKARLLDVALRLREIYALPDRATLERKLPPKLIEELVESVTQGLNGDVGVVPRQFLRKLVMILDLVKDDPEFEPRDALDLPAPDLTEEEQRLRDGRPAFDPEPGDDSGYAPSVIEF